VNSATVDEPTCLLVLYAQSKDVDMNLTQCLSSEGNLMLATRCDESMGACTRVSLQIDCAREKRL
jgi:hypothetical protein